jgi:hypothetical protein
LRKITSNIEGHPTPRLSFVDVATGSLGQVKIKIKNLRDLALLVDQPTHQNTLIISLIDITP